MLILGKSCIWAVLAVTASYLITVAGPHGMEAFFLSGCVLSLVGAAGHAAHALMGQEREIFCRGIAFDAALGAVYGIASFLLATWLFDRSMYLPHNLYQWQIVFFLSMTAAATNWVVNLIYARLARPLTGPGG